MGTTERQRVLITVKRYPTLSRKYGETVCTPGVRADASWVRMHHSVTLLLDEVLASHDARTSFSMTHVMRLRTTRHLACFDEFESARMSGHLWTTGGLIFVPDAACEHLLPRLLTANAQTIDGVASYLADRASSALLHALDSADPTLLDRALSVEPEPEGAYTAANLALRLHRESSSFGEYRRKLVEDALREGAEESGWCGFLDVEGLKAALPELEKNFVHDERERSSPKRAQSSKRTRSGTLTTCRTSGRSGTARNATNSRAGGLQMSMSSGERRAA